MRKNYKRIFIVALLFGLLGQDCWSQKPLNSPVVDYCDVLKSPNDFDGKRVTLRATYRYGFEWQEIFCLQCRDRGKTWLEIDDDAISPKSKKMLKKLPKNDGTINAIFTGKFESSKGPFGDGSYRFRFVLEEIRQAKLVSKSGFDPTQLPEDVRKKLCGWSFQG